MRLAEIVVTGAVMSLVGAGSGTFALSAAKSLLVQPGTPSKPAPPQNPQPEPKNPLPPPKNPLPQPKNPIPNPQNPLPRPNDRTPQPPASPDTTAPNSNTGSRRVDRPFTFSSPQAEARFVESTQRLVRMEQTMAKSQADILKKLGEARQLSGDRQTTALFDVIQQMLRDQANLQRYLVQSRAAWTGETLDQPADDTPDAQGTPMPAPESR